MDIAIRDTLEADLPAIFRIRTDPLVQPHQYRLSRHDTIDFWKQRLFGEHENGRVLFKSTTIMRHTELIGHIIHIHFGSGRRRISYCGWNLAPAYWGQGVAMIALSELFLDTNLEAHDIERIAQRLAQFHAPLIKRIYLPDGALREDRMLVKRDELA